MFFDRKRNVVLTLVVLAASACGPVEKLPEEEEQGFSSSDAPGRIQSNLTSSQHRARCDAIKTSSAGKAITNGLVIAGVAQLETQMGHCWSEATSSCQGPYSSYCGGPVLAGAADGPCSLRQGGLGMYQFDSGTYDQTLAEQGTTILSLSGNISRAVSFIINKVWSCPNTPYFNSESEVIAWINKAKPGTTEYYQYMKAMAWCYNGCAPDSGCDHDAMLQRYKSATDYLYNLYGYNYWYGTAQSCPYGDGLYCGGNGVTGNARNLYRCTGGSVTLAEVCIECERMPIGQNDRCKAMACPYGNGLYCGGNAIGGSSNTLYRCTDGKITTYQVCANGCVKAPVGQNDHCG